MTDTAYGTISATVKHEGAQAEIGYKTWASSRSPSKEEMTGLLKDHLAKYQMELIEITRWDVASDYGCSH